MIRLAAGLALIAGPAAAMSLPEGGGLAALMSLGFLVGIAHALDADHVAAVAAMMERDEGPRRAIARGMAWGVGHTLALFAICSTVLLLGLTISGRIEAGLELAVGLMIVALGLRVFWKLRRDRVHIHVHDHGGARHVHAHSHAGDPVPHPASAHAHRHRELLPTLGVGLVHGAAGSAGLLVLVVASAPTLGAALAAFAVFGVGSLLGMTALTAVASYPLALIHRGGAGMRTALALGVGALALGVGGGVIADSLAALGVVV